MLLDQQYHNTADETAVDHSQQGFECCCGLKNVRNDLLYITALHYITLKIFKVALIKTSRTTGCNTANKLQYNVQIRLPKQMRLQLSSKHQQLDCIQL